MSGEVFDGGCLCGSTRFAARAPSLFCVHCHCHWCRRAHGAAFVTWFGVPEAAFAIASGDDALVWYASSSESQRGFCRTCGTTMFYKSTIAPGEIHIALACTDGPIDRAPSAHIFFDAHVDWLDVRDDLPKCDRDHRKLVQFQRVPIAPPVASKG